MNTYIDIYCERLGPGFWAAPLNALTNLSFFIAAFLAYRLARDKNLLRPESGLLILLMAMIGTGSFLFHTFATGWAQLADVLPILLYQIAFIVVYTREVISRRKHITLGMLGLFFTLIYGVGHLPPDMLNGSLSYAPAILMLGLLSVFHYMKSKQEKGLLFMAAAVFGVSLTLRSVDMALCPAFHMGTHFFWHMLNGVVLYLSTRAYILNSKV